jgi:uncharacterized protein (DUF302 family)
LRFAAALPKLRRESIRIAATMGPQDRLACSARSVWSVSSSSIKSGANTLTLSASPPSRTAGIVSLASPYSHADTVVRLHAGFAEYGVKVFATIDQQAEALAVGLAMPPTTLIIFGNPRAGTPLMLAQPLSGLDLPLKALVTEAVPGQVVVSFNASAYIIERHGLPVGLAANLAPPEQLIAKLLAG